MQEIDIIICPKKINIKTYLKMKKIKKENMEKIGITICLKKKSKNIKRIKKKYREANKSKYNNE